MDISEVRRQVRSDLAIWGNIDALFIERASRDEIAEAVKEQWIAAGPLYAASPGSPLTADTPPYKLRWLIEAAHMAGEVVGY